MVACGLSESILPMKKRKICVITGTRAEYGLLYWVIRGIDVSDKLDLQMIATGMHLSPEFGKTYEIIEKDGFRIDKQVEMLLSSDSERGISKSIGLGVIGFADALSELQPDIVLVLGDRFEIFAASIAAMIAKIPLAHCHGGEATEGLIDEPIRHSITKMSHVHFTAADAYRQRVIQLGEQPENCFNVGGLGIENINKLSLLSKTELEKSLEFDLGEQYAVITFHPVTLEKDSAAGQFENLLRALESFDDLNYIFTMPNADTDGRIIISMIHEFERKHPHRVRAYVSLGQVRYLSSLKHCDLVLGNSSSGLTEAPALKIPTINIGDRQRGRLFAETVLCCEPKVAAIRAAMEQARSREFQALLPTATCPYGDGNSSEMIVPVLERIGLEGLVKKSFYNVDCGF